jgi:Arc/MetJ-type ribon-helix-helix transcriptional regulator
MNITLDAETQRLLKEQMERGGFASPEEVVRVALEHLNQVPVYDYADLDEETRAAIEEAEEEFERGEGIPLDEAMAKLRQKYLGR